jgi:hypothetical protein
MIDEDTHDRVGNLGRIGRLEDNAGVAGKTVMSLVSSRTGITPAPSNPTLNLRGRP